MLTKALLLAVAALASAGASAQITRASVELGMLAGVDKGAISAFLGIPFAAPPVGDNRWRAPQPAAKWTGIRSADRFGTNCQQDITPGSNGFGPWTPEYLIEGPVGEDCLYLNVWTPAKASSERHPVLFWIYGGGFSSGGTSVPVYDGAALAAQGIVVVSVNYRVGVYGFLAHPALAAEAGGSSGNYGLLDQIAGLEWVKRNIAAFGGDPDKVTISGQSAGAASVHDLIASPLANGLFSAAIAQSGSGMGIALPARVDAEAAGVRLQQAAGAASLAELRALSPAQLGEALRIPDPLASRFRFAPIADGVVLPADLDAALAQGRYHDTPLLTGLTADEGSAMSPEYRPADAAAYLASVQQRFGASADSFLTLYPVEAMATSAPALTRDRGIASMLLWADARRRTSKRPIYAYLFTHPEPGPQAARYGAFHSSEIPYVFGNLDKAPDRGFSDKDRAIQRTMGRYWVNFVKTGDPNGSGVPAWPALDDQWRIMELGSAFAPRVALSPEQAKAYRDHVASGGQLGIF